MNYAQTRLIVAQHRDERCVERNAMNVRYSAIDGIERQLVSRCADRETKFFAEDRVVGELRGDAFSKQVFSRAISDRYRCVVGFAFDLKIAAAKISERNITCFPGHRDGKF